jgi:hypothetical protein
MNGLRTYRFAAIRLTLVYVLVLNLLNISIDTTDHILHGRFWVSEIESVFELVSEQVLGISDCVSDHDENDVETTLCGVSASSIVMDVVSVRLAAFGFKPVLVNSLEAALEQRNFYSDISRAKLTPPPRIS